MGMDLLVDPASSFDDAFLLELLTGLVIEREFANDLPAS